MAKYFFNISGTKSKATHGNYKKTQLLEYLLTEMAPLAMELKLSWQLTVS